MIVAFWLIEAQYGLGNVVQDVNSREALSFLDLIYFSSITYTSVGFGDVVPLVGTMQFPRHKVSKEDLLAYWEAVRRRTGLTVREGCKFLTLEKRGEVITPGK